MSEGLLPCPFCGGEAEPCEVGGFWWVQCKASCGSPLFGLRPDAVAAWNRRAPALTWTPERPTVPGWYWGRHPHVLDLVMVWVGQDAIDRDEFNHGTQWAGPIPEPAEPNQLSDAEREEAERLYHELVADVAAGDTWGLPPEPPNPRSRRREGRP